MTIEERVTKLETFAADVREYTRVLTEVIRHHDERIDGFDDALNNLTAKIGALADAQIRTEDAIVSMRVEIGGLAENTRRNTADINQLAEIVRRLAERNGQA